MKTFLLALVLFSLMLAGVTWNALYINKVANELEEQISALPPISSPDCEAAARAIRDYWDARKDRVALSARFSLSDRISEQAETLLACASCGDLYGFVTARALFLDAIDDLARTETLRAGV